MYMYIDHTVPRGRGRVVQHLVQQHCVRFHT